MYVYFYDNFLKDRKYASMIKNIEAKLTDFGISGKVLRLQQFVNPLQIIEEEKSKGATTIVVVGDDTTFGYVLSHAALCGVTFGYIPVRGPSHVADLLGIPQGEPAIDVLSRRRRLSVDVGQVHGTGQLFVSELLIEPAYVQVVCDQRFAMSSGDSPLEVAVYNLTDKTKRTTHPQDRRLAATIRPQQGKKRFGRVSGESVDDTVVPFKELHISAQKPFNVQADGTAVSSSEIVVTLAAQQAHLIVGTDRQF